MKTRIVYPKRWKDEDYISCSDQAVRLFEYLIGNDDAGLTRFAHINDRLLAFGSGLDSEKLEGAKKELEAIKWCFFYKGWIYHNHDAAYVDYTGGPEVTAAKKVEFDHVPQEVKDYFFNLATRGEGVPQKSPTSPRQDINHKSETINQKPESINGSNKTTWSNETRVEDSVGYKQCKETARRLKHGH